MKHLIQLSHLKTLSLSKLSWSTLFLSLPLNFLAIQGIGSIYLSTIVLFVNFLLVFLFTNGKVIAHPSNLVAISIFGLFLFSTIWQMMFGSTGSFKDQLVFTIVHIQLLIAFILGNYYMRHLSRDFIFSSLIIIFLLLSIRLFIDDIDKVFNLSTVRGLRVESQFAGGANNFGLLIGMGFIVVFFYLEKGLKRLLLGLYFFLIVILTMSRGALFGVILTLVLVALYETKGKTLLMLLRISFGMTISGIILFFISDTAQIFFEKFSNRFLSFFTGEVSLEQASSGRGMIITDLFENHLKNADFFQILFGHGMGSINFVVKGAPYESSHNIFIDILFRNGLISLIGFLLLVIYLCYSFLKNRGKDDLVIFAVFVFLHFEIMVNPFVYAAQSGWIYGVFLALFLGKKHLRNIDKPVLNNTQ